MSLHLSSWRSTTIEIYPKDNRQEYGFNPDAKFFNVIEPLTELQERHV